MAQAGRLIQEILVQVDKHGPWAIRVAYYEWRVTSVLRYSVTRVYREAWTVPAHSAPLGDQRVVMTCDLFDRGFDRRSERAQTLAEERCREHGVKVMS